MTDKAELQSWKNWGGHTTNPHRKKILFTNGSPPAVFTAAKPHQLTLNTAISPWTCIKQMWSRFSCSSPSTRFSRKNEENWLAIVAQLAPDALRGQGRFHLQGVKEVALYVCNTVVEVPRPNIPHESIREVFASVAIQTSEGSPCHRLRIESLDLVLAFDATNSEQANPTEPLRKSFLTLHWSDCLQPVALPFFGQICLPVRPRRVRRHFFTMGTENRKGVYRWLGTVGSNPDTKT